ncbi:hypothetical protein SALWKB2_1648 [Snodgrassella alvi wkB2]|uniref:Lipoprotein n=1 Tax=Snodgrassella alvi TaxID=1196083 RepID=A0ABD7Z0P0_9NEIS|nr:hypothetical protein [Snodgrassella alvi]AHN29030.1 hypothetical protein SALWKB2_1648 [Snodgrassella alvi wkB2]PIT45563.1 hypothetical protein BHC45_04195 [Snodgrassella alvi]UOO97931.1 hypothetical protein LVJ87_07640 [Snodgrassella alvi wkB2]WLS98124.1 hypothetical protein RAM05_09775 [Snodgrassella alvi]
MNLFKINKNFVAMLLVILLSACNKTKSLEASYKTDTLNVNTEFITEKNINLNQIQQIPVNTLVSKYPPLTDSTFILGKGDGVISEFRISLRNTFTEKEIENRDIIIREVTWSCNQDENLTIWYEKKQDQWVLVDHVIWYKDALF